MSKRDDIKRELKKQEEEFYGDETVSGSAPDPDSDDSVETMVEEAMGEDAAEHVDDPQEGGFNIADEVNEDEEEVLEGGIVDYQDKEGLAVETAAKAPAGQTGDDDDDEDEEEDEE